MPELFPLSSARELYPVVLQEVRELRMRWAMFVALYGTSSDRVDLLRDAAPVSFGLVQEGLRDSILLRLSQLASKEKEGGHAQVSFASLIEALQRTNSVAVVDLKQKLDLFVEQTSAAEAWRDRRIAHRDRDVIDRPDLLPPIARQQITIAVETAIDVLGLADLAIHGSDSVHGDPVPCDVERLMKRLSE